MLVYILTRFDLNLVTYYGSDYCDLQYPINNVLRCSFKTFICLEPYRNINSISRENP